MGMNSAARSADQEMVLSVESWEFLRVCFAVWADRCV